MSIEDAVLGIRAARREGLDGASAEQCPAGCLSGWVIEPDNGAGSAKPCPACQDPRKLGVARALRGGLGQSEIHQEAPQGRAAQRAIGWFRASGEKSGSLYPTLVVCGPPAASQAVLAAGFLDACIAGDEGVWLTQVTISRELDSKSESETLLDRAWASDFLVIPEVARASGANLKWPERRVAELVAERSRHGRLTALGWRHSAERIRWMAGWSLMELPLSRAVTIELEGGQSEACD